MKISYSITVCNELREIKSLIHCLQENIRPEDEIVVVFDSTNGTEEVHDYLFDIKRNGVLVYEFEFKNDFSALKNYLKTVSTGDYVFFLDADEIPNPVLLRFLPELLTINNIEAYWVPRINIVNNITIDYIKQQRWTINEQGWINWPNDAQLRIIQNKPEIRWIGKVHEKLTGFHTLSRLPDSEEYSLLHIKEFERQIKQNNLYEKISS